MELDQRDLSQVCVIILAAGKGTRMKSEESKVFFPFLGKPLLSHILQAAQGLSTKKILVVVSPADFDRAKELYHDTAEIVIQEEPKGTGDAVKKALNQRPGEKYYLILCGDTPLIQSSTLLSLSEIFFKTHADAALITAIVEQAKMYGRIKRNPEGDIEEIIEYKDATQEEKNIHEINSGMYLFKAAALKETLHYLKDFNAAKEVYLTDTLKQIRQKNGTISSYQLEGEKEIFGINNRRDLSRALMMAYQQKNESLMLEEGVTIIDPEHTFIDPRAKIGQDSIIKPYCYLEGPVCIGKNVSIGPYACMRASEDKPIVIESHCQVGPFTSLRGGTHLKQHVHVGTFVEVKNSTLDQNTKAMHQSYLGDAEIGKKVNIGAGTITCNYDGQTKHKTIIKDGAFIGSDAILVAPLSIGELSYVAAGSTITKDIPDQSLGIGRSRQENKIGWKKRAIIKKNNESKGDTK